MRFERYHSLEWKLIYSCTVMMRLVKIKFRLAKLEQTIIVNQLIAVHSYSIYSVIFLKY